MEQRPGYNIVSSKIMLIKRGRGPTDQGQGDRGIESQLSNSTSELRGWPLKTNVSYGTNLFPSLSSLSISPAATPGTVPIASFI